MINNPILDRLPIQKSKAAEGELMYDDNNPQWSGHHKIEIFTVKEVIKYSERMIIEILEGGTKVSGTGFWKGKDGELHYDEDQITFTSYVEDPARIRFVKRAVSIIAASLNEESIMCVTTLPDGTITTEFLDSKEVLEEEFPDATRLLQWPWPEDLFSPEFIAAYASTTIEHSERTEKKVLESLKKMKSEEDSRNKHPLSTMLKLNDEHKLAAARKAVEAGKVTLEQINTQLDLE